ncbi:hypothetical protein TrVE_jg2049 [Triparma verrucosa]|uniref:CRC domain-containing protein n=1 Tax=Triparma verrucosa TaxID=1606542 RepID=A0A9W7BLW6_9STRA|nr:hypothetical protein TrVE_jg2049 [Triparma verrucosa]
MQQSGGGDDGGETSSSSGRHSLHSALPIHPLSSRSIGSVLDLGQQNKQCNCKRSNCLKLYCECFAIGIYCNPAICNCVLCWNNEEGGSSRIKAVQSTLERNPHAFRAKLTGSLSQSQTVTNNATDVSKGCNCKKSGCLKKYCECFQQSIECGARCKCKECKNVKGNPEREKIMSGASPAAYTTPSRKGTPIYRGGTSQGGVSGLTVLPPSFYATPVVGNSGDLVEVALGEGKEGTHYWEKPRAGEAGAGEWVGGGFRVLGTGDVGRKRERGWLKEGLDSWIAAGGKVGKAGGVGGERAGKKKPVVAISQKPQNQEPVDFACEESIDDMDGIEKKKKKSGVEEHDNGGGDGNGNGNGNSNGRGARGRAKHNEIVTFRDTATPQDRMDKLRSMIKEIRRTTEKMAVDRMLAKQRQVERQAGGGLEAGTGGGGGGEREGGLGK